MGFCCAQHLIFAIPLLIFLLSTTSHLRSFNVQGRQTPRNSEFKEDETMWRSQIGSRPPRCERHCEAIQVPTNAHTTTNEEGNSNYKPMSWKCKCGNLIFNP